MVKTLFRKNIYLCASCEKEALYIKCHIYTTDLNWEGGGHRARRCGSKPLVFSFLLVGRMLNTNIYIQKFHEVRQLLKIEIIKKPEVSETKPTFTRHSHLITGLFCHVNILGIVSCSLKQARGLYCDQIHV